MHNDPATFAPDIDEIKSERYRFLHTWHGAGQHVEPHSHCRTTAMLVLRGAFTEVLDTHTYRLSPLDLVFKPPGVFHTNDYPDGAECFVIEFNESSESFLREIGVDLRNDTWVGAGSTSAAAIRLYQLLFISGHADSLALDEAIFLFVTELRGRFSRETPVFSPPWISTIRDCLMDAPEGPPSLADLAELAGVHPAHLCRTFRARFGTTIGQYARRIRIDRAVEMIAAAEASLTTIALRLGYFDQAHFTRDFCQFTGMPPGRFRRMVRSGLCDANRIQD